MPKSSKARANAYDLHLAIVNFSLCEVQKLLLCGVVDINQPVKGSTALSLALYSGNDDIFNALLDSQDSHKPNPLDVNCLSRDQQLRVEPPIVTAARLGNYAAVCRLLALGADIEAMDNIGHSALWIAAKQRQFAVAVELIRGGARVCVSSRASWLPVFAAARLTSRRTDIAQLLILCGADDFNTDGESLLKRLVAPGRLNAVALLWNAAYVRVESSSMSDNSDVAEFLRSITRQPASLQHQCRWAIRHVVSMSTHGSNYLPAILTLPLPKRMLNYVALVDTVSEWQEPISSFGCYVFPNFKWSDILNYLMK